MYGTMGLKKKKKRVMNVRVPKVHKISQAAEEILAFQKELCSMELVSLLLS